LQTAEVEPGQSKGVIAASLPGSEVRKSWSLRLWLSITTHWPSLAILVEVIAIRQSPIDYL
jgi:hypothetical protein